MKHLFTILIGSVLAANTSSAALNWNFSFTSSSWTHGGTTATGWGGLTTKQSTGTTTVNAIDSANNNAPVSLGITATFSQIGTALGATHSQNGQYTTGPNFTGVVFGNKAESDRNTGSLANYGVLTLVFDRAVSGGFTLGDIDAGGQAPVWRDAIAAEAWNGTVGAIGSGIAPSSVARGQDVQAVTGIYSNIGSYYDPTKLENTNFAQPNSLVMNWNTEFTTLKFYVFNSGAGSGDHGIGLRSGGSTVPLEPGVNDGLIPEPSSALLGLLGGLMFFKRRR